MLLSYIPIRQIKTKEFNTSKINTGTNFNDDCGILKHICIEMI